MTVAELIHELQAMPPEVEVRVMPSAVYDDSQDITNFVQFDAHAAEARDRVVLIRGR